MNTFVKDLQSTITVDADEVFQCVKRYWCPEDVFDYGQLADWAEENGFVKKGEEE